MISFSERTQDDTTVFTIFLVFRPRPMLKILNLLYYSFIKTLFNSCERLLLGTLILEIKAGDRNHKSDLIQYQTGNGLRHASGPVRLTNVTPLHEWSLVKMYNYFVVLL